MILPAEAPTSSQPCFDKLFQLRDGFKQFLQEKFGIIKVEAIAPSSQEEVSHSLQDYLGFFVIEKKAEPIYSSINSIDDFQKIKESILNLFDAFITSFEDYFERIEDQLDKKDIESLEIILKTLQNRRKKFDTALKRFKPEDTWGVSKISEEFSFELTKLLKDLIDATMMPITTGIKTHSCYQDILKLENKFLSELGIYTDTLSVGDKVNEVVWEKIFPQECEDCKTDNKDKHDVIKELFNYPYLFSESCIISEAKVTLWKYQE